MVERFNRILETTFFKFAVHSQRDWDQHLPLFLMAYRSVVHHSTGCIPANITLGRNLRLTFDLTFRRPVDEPPLFATDYVVALEHQLGHIHQFNRDYLNVITDRIKQGYDMTLLLSAHLCIQRMSPDSKIQRGRRVLFQSYVQLHWQGLYTITKKINDMVYRVQLKPQSKLKIVHCSQLWP